MEVGCNLKRPDAGELAAAVRDRVAALATAAGVAVLGDYSTNPFPQDVLPRFLAGAGCEWVSSARVDVMRCVTADA